MVEIFRCIVNFLILINKISPLSGFRCREDLQKENRNHQRFLHDEFLSIHRNIGASEGFHLRRVCVISMLNSDSCLLKYHYIPASNPRDRCRPECRAICLSLFRRRYGLANLYFAVAL